MKALSIILMVLFTFGCACKFDEHVSKELAMTVTKSLECKNQEAVYKSFEPMCADIKLCDTSYSAPGFRSMLPDGEWSTYGSACFLASKGVANMIARGVPASWGCTKDELNTKEMEQRCRTLQELPD